LSTKIENVSVNYCRFDILTTQHFPDDADVAAIFYLTMQIHKYPKTTPTSKSNPE